MGTGSVGWSLLRKTNKAALARSWRGMFFSCRGDPRALCYLIDRDEPGPETEGKRQHFFTACSTALSPFVMRCAKSMRIDVVFDSHRRIHQDAERATEVQAQDPFKNIQPGHNIQQWRSYSVVPPTRPVS
ncbi:hypothetical protein GWK47_035150 [Chionoecetes opilio]|uniref:Uncharacterized protein n=1 Tax=Chionoecetes opilio TaxID=41210 RepID=A0A8J5D2K1_CHIOP|nr:hypothetical protein GWK47_035150 [Chionoecetes opilio]